MKLYKDLTNIILKYTYGFCESCESQKHYTNLHIDEICHAGSLICFPCGLVTCRICAIEFNRLMDSECADIDDMGIVCGSCYSNLDQCDQCFALTRENVICSTCNLSCCMSCKEDGSEMCFACEQLLELFEEMANDN